MGSRRFAVLILTHGRPDHVMTVGALRRSGYTGKTYLVVDNEDATRDRYRDLFGPENVIEFDKAAVARTFDTADTSDDRRAIVYARNASFDIARSLGLDYFLQLDDDYQFFGFRYLGATPGATHPRIQDMDAVNEAMLDFLDASGADAVAMAQGGDYVGDPDEKIAAGLLRKAMNSFYVRTDRPVRFVGRINEDVNTYVVRGGRGALFFTITGLELVQRNTQRGQGGMTGLYLDAGTYVKSFYTVMMAPSCVKVGVLGPVNVRYHHHIRWDHAVPKIISERYRKAAA